MEACYYHAENQSETVCPDCMMAICAQCLEDGNGDRCGACRFYLEDSGGRVLSQQASGDGLGYDALSLTGYTDAPEQPSRQVSSAVPAKFKGKTNGKPVRVWPMIKRGLKVLTVLALLGGTAWGGMQGYKWYQKYEADKKKKNKPVPIALSIKQPANRALVSHTYKMVFDVVSPKHIKSLDVNIDGKYWGRMRQAPFTLEWQTSLFTNGEHIIQATAIYADGRKVTQKRTVRVRNVY